MKNLKKELVKYGRKIYDRKLVIGAGGNISVRSRDKIYIKASGASLGRSGFLDYNEVDLKTGKTICLKGPCSIEMPMHIACYKARPDIGAVIHVHPIYGTIMGIIKPKLGYISYEFTFAMKSEIPVINYKRPGSSALALAVGKAVKRHNGVLLKNHGAIVVGKDLEEAYERTLALERAARIYVFSKLCGKVSFVPKNWRS